MACHLEGTDRSVGGYGYDNSVSPKHASSPLTMGAKLYHTVAMVTTPASPPCSDGCHAPRERTPRRGVDVVLATDAPIFREAIELPAPR